MSMFRFIRSKWYRKHERKIWIGLTVVIALTFGITMQIGDIGRQSARDQAQTVYGEEVDPYEIQDLEARWRLTYLDGPMISMYMWDLLQVGLLEWGDASLLYQGRAAGRALDTLSERLAWDVCMLTRACRRNGIVVSDEDVREHVRSRVERAQNRGRSGAPVAGFDREFYAEMLKQMQLSAAQFEQTVREFLAIQRLLTSVRQSVTVEEEEVWSRFVEQNRQVEGLVVPFELAAYQADSKPADAREVVQRFKELLQDPEESPAFEVPKRVAFEYLMVDEDLASSVVPDPTEAEIQRDYDANKDQMYVNPAWTAPPPGGTNSTNSSASSTSTTSSTSSTSSTESTTSTAPAATPIPRYKTLDDLQVRNDIVNRLRNQASQERIDRFFENVESAMLAEAPQEVSWGALQEKIGIISSDRKFNAVVYGVTPALSRDRVAEVMDKLTAKPPAAGVAPAPTPAGGAAQLSGTMAGYFDALPNENAALGTPSADKVADFFMSRPVKVPRGSAIARVVGVEKSYTPPVLTEDLRERIETRLRKEKARQAARQDALALRDSIRRAAIVERETGKPESSPTEAERSKRLRELTASVTRRTADQAHRACFETGPVKSSEKIGSLTSMDPGDSTQLSKTLHEEMEPGEVRVAETDKVICVVALLEKLAPKADDFLSQSDSLRESVRSQKGSEAQKAWIQTFRRESGVDEILARQKHRGG
ncbi:MAG: SurA N-terminal domain-containing protein [Planctomycetes bacterium]|nr:SurA N-terminal domain-containing protein [Planctomycetota bacterium]